MGIREERRIARCRLDSLYPVLVRTYADRRNSDGLVAISKVVCSILSSRTSMDRLATASKPLAYLQRCVRNALRHTPPKKELMLLGTVALAGDGTSPTGAAPRARGGTPCDELLRKELSIEVAKLVRTLPPPKRAAIVLWMRDFTSSEMARTLGMSRAMARYHVSTGLARLLRELMDNKGKWRIILTDFGPTDCIPMSA